MSAAEVHEAAARASAHKFIEAMPLGYETKVSVCCGVVLEACAEWQRVVGLYADRPIVWLFHDAWSALSCCVSTHARHP